MAGVIVHEWVEPVGGSERVLQSFLQLYPDADLVCAWDNTGGTVAGTGRSACDRRIRETWVARTPARRLKQVALPLLAVAWRQIPMIDYEWALVSSHAFAHHIRTGPVGTRPGSLAARSGIDKYVYVHSPARYLWEPGLDHRGSGALMRAAGVPFRRLDRRRAAEATGIAANSRYVRDRIRRVWDRDATVIHPPVAVAEIQAGGWRSRLTVDDEALLESLPAEFVLGASRMISYKRLDLVIRAGERAGCPVVLAGQGPESQRLRSMAEQASVPVIFVDAPSTELLWELYGRALVYVFPAVEDFGLMPVEAMAAGVPVLCSAAGGTTESVVDAVTGIHVAHWDSDDLGQQVHRAAALDPADVRKRAREFDHALFEHRIREWIGR